jgi:general secretion pathway protein G
MRSTKAAGPAQRSKGITLVELVSASAVILVLAGVAIPVASTMVKRQKELQLRQALREIRTAINRFQQDSERLPGMRGPSGVLNATNEEGYPEKLEHLYQGIDAGLPKLKIKYLRRLPRDPMTGKTEWGTRSSRDEPEAMFSDGINIFDVRSTSPAKGLNDVPYAKW